MNPMKTDKCCETCYWSDSEAFGVLICVNRDGDMFQMKMPYESCDKWTEDQDGIPDSSGY